MRCRGPNGEGRDREARLWGDAAAVAAAAQLLGAEGLLFAGGGDLTALGPKAASAKALRAATAGARPRARPSARRRARGARALRPRHRRLPLFIDSTGRPPAAPAPSDRRPGPPPPALPARRCCRARYSRCVTFHLRHGAPSCLTRAVGASCLPGLNYRRVFRSPRYRLFGGAERRDTRYVSAAGAEGRTGPRIQDKRRW